MDADVYVRYYRVRQTLIDMIVLMLEVFRPP